MASSRGPAFNVVPWLFGIAGAIGRANEAGEEPGPAKVGEPPKLLPEPIGARDVPVPV